MVIIEKSIIEFQFYKSWSRTNFIWNVKFNENNFSVIVIWTFAWFSISSNHLFGEILIFRGIQRTPNCFDSSTNTSLKFIICFSSFRNKSSQLHSESSNSSCSSSYFLFDVILSLIWSKIGSKESNSKEFNSNS